MTAVRRHFHPLPPPSAAHIAELQERELAELTAILARYGFAEPDACAVRLQAEGLGVHETLARARMPAAEIGGLTYTHGFSRLAGAL